MAKFTFTDKLKTAMKYPYLRAAGYPTLINLEVTKRCNARCDFCDYWKTTEEERMEDYAPVIQKLKPVVVMLTGGEPLLRKDLEQIVHSIKQTSKATYVGVISNGALLKYDRGMSLWHAGLDQLAVSLDFLDERHDKARGIPRLYERLSNVIPKLVDGGVDNFVLNSVIKSDNLDDIVNIVHQAESWGAKVSFSAYADVKVGNKDHNVTSDSISRLRLLIDQLIELKQAGKPILSTEYYLRRIPEYFETGHIGGCVAGRKFVTVTPDGYIKRCSEFRPECHYTEWTPDAIKETKCDICWFSCRGETQAPLTVERLKQSISL